MSLTLPGMKLFPSTQTKTNGVHLNTADELKLACFARSRTRWGCGQAIGLFIHILIRIMASGNHRPSCNGEASANRALPSKKTAIALPEMDGRRAQGGFRPLALSYLPLA